MRWYNRIVRKFSASIPKTGQASGTTDILYDFLMRIVREHELAKFATRHPNTSASLNYWPQLMREESFKSIIDLRETFGRVSPVKVRPGGLTAHR